jgi:hypothetical protein
MQYVMIELFVAIQLCVLSLRENIVASIFETMQEICMWVALRLFKTYDVLQSVKSNFSNFNYWSIVK